MPADSRPVLPSVLTLDTPHGPLVFGGRCGIMAVLNVTPDSFSDGGRFSDAAAAADEALRLAADGADVIDVGPESTRPGAADVDPDEQIRRAVSVIAAARQRGLTIPLSIDTRSAVVAEAALDAGADLVNDVSGGTHDAAMPKLLARRRVPFVVMHMQGTPRTMQNDPKYDDVVDAVSRFFIQRAEALGDAHVDVGRMIVDPGLGFGKTREHNLELLAGLPKLCGRWPVLVGPSRKRFIGDITGEAEASRRIFGTAAAVAHCALAGAGMVRVHDVKAMRQVVDVSQAIRTAS